MKSLSPFTFLCNLPFRTIAIVAGLWITDLHAVDQTWSSNDTTANWSSSSNWGGLAAPGAAGTGGSINVATFAAGVGTVGTSGNPVIFDSAWSIGSIVFDTSTVGPFFIGTTGGNIITANGSATAGIIVNSSVTNTQTVNAPISIRFNSGVFGLVNNAAGSSALLKVGGGITSVGTGGTTTLTLGGSNTGNNTYSGVLGNGVSGATVAVKKAGTGTWLLTGANTYTGATTLQGGNLVLDYTAAGAPTSNIISSSSALTLGTASTASSQTLTIEGKAGTANTQTLGNVTFSAASGFGSGSSHINLNAGGSGGTLALTLGTLSAKVGGATLDFALSSGASVKVGTASAVTGTGSGLFANVVTINGTDFATNDGNAANDLVGLSTISGAYDTSTTVSATLTKALDVQGGATSITNTVTLPAMRFNQAGAAAVTIASGQTPTVNGGILVTSNVGANTTTITGGSVRGYNGRDLSLTQNNVNGRLQVDSIIVSNGASGLTKSGQGLAVLTGANTYTGATYVNEGTLLVSNTVDSGTGTGNVSVVSGATLGGTGTITPGVGNSVTVSGILAPGNSTTPATLTINSTTATGAVATFASGASFAFDLTAGTGSDNLALINGAAGDFVFNNNNIAFTLSGTLANGQTYTLFSADAADAFSGLSLDGSNHVTSGLTFSGLGGAFESNSYISKVGNNLVLTAVPEPATALYLLSGLGLLIGIQSFRRRQTGL